MKTILAGLSIFGLLLIWYFRTWLHGIALFLFATPVIWQVFLLTLLVHFGCLVRIKALTKKHTVNTGKPNSDAQFAWISIVSPTVFVILLTFGLVAANVARNLDLAQQLEYISIGKLPESTEELRLMPYQVAERYAKDSLQLSQYKLGTENIAFVNGELSWTFPLTPDGLIITFLRKNKGTVTIDATTQEKNATHSWKDMAIGEGMQITDNLHWNLYRRHYFITPDNPFYVSHDDQIYTVVGATGYSYRFRWGILYTVPYFRGLFLTDTAGSVQFLSPQEALTHPVLQDNRVFPENLARKYVEAYEYHLGVLNKWFIHEDQIQIQDVQNTASSVNRQPYLMNTEDGLKWFVSTEPYGASHGIFKIFLIDARTGEIGVYHLPTEETLTGPVRAVDYVRRSNPVVDWSRFDSVEPLPFIRQDSLYWKLTVIPQDAAGIAYQAFVDAYNNEVYELQSDNEVRAFLRGMLDKQPVAEGSLDKEEVTNLIRQKLQEIEELLDSINPSDKGKR